MRKLLLLLSCMCLMTAHVWAQTRTIKGKVLDEKGKPLSSVSIAVKGSNAGTTSSADGTFSLMVSSTTKKLEISFTGYSTEELKINSADEYTITLKTDYNSLSEVVVVGYGTQRKRDVTGSIFKLKDSTFQDIPLQGPDQALRGKVPGVSVTQSSGTPGSAINVQIRGVGSINSSTQPLYVIDGVILNTGDYTQVGVGGQALNALADINPNDIESYEILKDAAAAAIYGARGANGVVLITTKKGGNQKTKINLDIAFGPQKTWKQIPTLSGPSYVQLVQDEINAYGQQFYQQDFKPSDFGLAGLDNDPKSYPTTNWQDLIFRKGNTQNYQLSAAGGNEKTQFYMSGGYTGQNGIILGSDYARYNTRINLDHRVSSKFKIFTNLSLSRSLTNRIDNDNDIYGVLSTAVLSSSFYKPYNEDGTYAHDPNLGILENPIAAGTLRHNKAITDRAIGSLAGEYQILPSLTLRVQGSADYIALNEAQFLPSNTNEGAAGPNGIGREGYNKGLNLLNENILTFRKSFGDHNITATAVASYNQYNFESIYGEGKNFPGNSIQRLSAASVKSVLTSTGTSYGIIGYLGRLNYDFKGKYYASASIRRDGSSRLGKYFHYGTFPAFSAAWRISEEKFLKNNATISDLKLRASWGKLGNSETGNFASKALVAPGFNYVVGGSDVPGLAPTQIGNDSLKWEASQQADIGLELGLFRNKILLSVDVYKKQTKDLLLNRPLVGSSGFTSVNQNIGEIENKGIEFGLNTTIVETKNFSWSSSFNIAFNKNKIVKISGSSFPDGFASWIEAGQPIGSFYGYKRVGIFQSQADVDKAPKQSQYTTAGDIQFADINKDGTVDSKDQVVLGNASPKFSGGFTNTFSYKGIQLSFFLQFVSGNKIYNETRAFAEGENSLFGQYNTVEKRWTPTNTNTNIPRAILSDPANNTRNSDRWLEDGSFMRLKNIILAYQIPKDIINKIKLNTVKVFVQAQNLKTWTKYSGFDPEVSAFSITNTAQGTDFLTYPQARVITFGVNVGL